MEELRAMESETLRELNRKIVAELRRRQDRETQSSMEEFRQGDNVRFFSRGRTYTGRVLYRNRKTVSVTASDGRQWRVAPQLLTKI